MRDRITSCLEIAGLATIAGGCFLVALPLGLLVAGAALVLVGYVEGRK